MQLEFPDFHQGAKFRVDRKNVKRGKEEKESDRQREIQQRGCREREEYWKGQLREAKLAGVKE